MGDIRNLHKQFANNMSIVGIKKNAMKKKQVTNWLGNVQAIVMIKALLGNGFLAPVTKMTTSFKVE